MNLFQSPWRWYSGTLGYNYMLGLAGGGVNDSTIVVQIFAQPTCTQVVWCTTPSVDSVGVNVALGTLEFAAVLFVGNIPIEIFQRQRQFSTTQGWKLKWLTPINKSHIHPMNTLSMRLTQLISM